MSLITRGSVRDWIRPEVRALPAYAISEGDSLARLDRNESPEEISEDLRQRVLDKLAAARWSRYPDPFAAELKTLLARREGLSSEAILVGNGSNALFLSLFVSVAAAGRRIGLCPPTFGLYAPWIRGAGGTVVDFALTEEDLAPPTEVMLEAAREDPDLAFVLCSPNNPTGTIFPRDGLVGLLDAGSFVVVDEAYVEFSGTSGLDLLARYPNLLLARTFSKAAALAGVRVGYMLGAPEVVREIEKVLPPYSVNLFARAAAAVALGDESGTRARVASIVRERERMAAEIRGVAGARLSPSAANFLYLRPERPAAELFEELRRRGVLVRRVASTRAEALRVTVGRPQENDRFLEVWREVMG